LIGLDRSLWTEGEGAVGNPELKALSGSLVLGKIEEN